MEKYMKIRGEKKSNTRGVGRSEERGESGRP